MHKFSLTSNRRASVRATLHPAPIGVWRQNAARWALAVVVGCLALLVIAPTALAAGTGAITGTVTEASGSKNPVENVSVEVNDSTTREYGFATTNKNGEYTVEHLTPGSYTVEFSAAQGVNLAPQYYKESSTLSGATSVPVKEAEATPNIDAKLKVGGEISGTVTDTSGHELEDIEVYVNQTGGGEGYFFGGYAETNAKGEYTVVGLPTGSYTVVFYPAALNFVPQYYEGASLFSQAKQISVTEGGVMSGIDAELQVGGEISGTVTDAVTHAPLANVYVTAESVGEGFGGYAETGPNGEYTILGLGTGSYNVEFYSENAGVTEYITQLDRGIGVTVERATSGVNVALVRKAPVNTAAPVLSGTATVGQTLSCSTGSWTGGPTPTYSYAWLRNGSAITGATGSSYVVQSADQGTGLACRVTGKNKSGAAAAVSNTVTVPFAPPPPPPPVPSVKLLSSKIVVSGSFARVSISCASASCAGTIELTEQIVVKHRKGKRTTSRKKTVVLGKGSYSLAAGKSATIVVRLTSAGKSALAKAKRHKLLAKAVVSVAGGTTVAKAVVLSRPAPRRRKRK